MTDFPPPDQPQYGQPGQPQYGQPGQPQYGQPGQPQYGQPGQPQYGQPGQPQYGQPGQPQYGQPPQGGFPPGPGGPGYPPGPGGPGGFPPGPGGPGGPGFGPYGPPPGRNNKTPWIIGGIALVAVAAIAVVLVLVMGGSDKKSGPAAAAQKYLDAGKSHNIAAAKAVSCGDLLDELNGTSGSGGAGQDLKSYKLGKTQEHGTSAQVFVEVTLGAGGQDDPPPGTYPLVFTAQKQSDGKWKVCTLGQASGSGGGGNSAPASHPGNEATSVPTDLPSGLPSDFPTDLPTGLPTGGGTGSFCVTPQGSSPICIPQ